MKAHEANMRAIIARATMAKMQPPDLSRQILDIAKKNRSVKVK